MPGDPNRLTLEIVLILTIVFLFWRWREARSRQTELGLKLEDHRSKLRLSEAQVQDLQDKRRRTEEESEALRKVDTLEEEESLDQLAGLAHAWGLQTTVGRAVARAISRLGHECVEHPEQGHWDTIQEEVPHSCSYDSQMTCWAPGHDSGIATVSRDVWVVDTPRRVEVVSKCVK
jgi:hypothetical protein